MKNRILVVDDEISHCKMLEAVLGEEGYDVTTTNSGESALEITSRTFYDLILLDIRMKGMDGVETLKELKKISPETGVIMMTAYASLKTAIETLKTGASDYLTKPLNTDELIHLIEKTLHHSRLTEENRMLKERLGRQFVFQDIIGRSPAMAAVLETLKLAAPTDATILVTGESGTGKELIANAIHENSLRKEKPFVKVNCAALPETLLESELFGYMKGAFTGADTNKKGKFALADTGTIFLDEIGEMSPATQAKLLRVLQENEFDPIGSARPEKVDIRIVAATNKNLEEEVRQGRFREDLFYRLNVVVLELPPLRERLNDIEPLVHHFLKKYSEKNRKPIEGITAEALGALMGYTWPGNVRELENSVERAVILSPGEMIETVQLPNLPDGTGATGSLRLTTIKEMEKELILMTLDIFDGNRTHAAESLGISRRALQLKLKTYESG